MSYYGGNSANGAEFYTHVKMKNLNDNPIDTVQVIAHDPFRINEHGFVTGGWDGLLK